MENSHQSSENSGVQTTDKSKVSIVLFPMPFQGHQNQFMHFSRVITSSYDNVSVHFVGPEIHNRQAIIRSQGWNPLSVPNLHFHNFLLPPFEVILPNPEDPRKFPAHLWPLLSAMLELQDPINKLLQNLSKSSKRVVILTDVIMSWVVEDFPSSFQNVELYLFHLFPAFALYCFICGYAGKPVLIDGKPANDLPTVEAIFRGDALVSYLKAPLESEDSYHGNLYNCSRIIEGEFLNRLEEIKINGAEKHWVIGPLNLVTTSSPANDSDSNNCKWIFDWLDKQPARSVIYVAFGTVTSFSNEQVKEIALGLEQSGQNFIWLLRHADLADYSESGGTGAGRDNINAQLPEGFEERMGGRGMIIRGEHWVPQLKILGHPATGGFLSHCGWNSCIESISMGVPIAAWPMHSEQPLNAILIQRVLRIGVPVRECTIQVDEIVRSEAIENAVRTLMDSPEGQEMRERAEKLGAAVRKSVEKEGDVAAEIGSFVSYICRDE